MREYRPKYPDNLIIHQPSATVISVGWSEKNQVLKQIGNYKFAAIGNLYSVAGIDVLIRNLTHNYQVTRLIHLAKSPLDRNVPTTDTLVGIWQGSDYPGIDEDVLIAVVDRVQLFVVHSIDRLTELLLIDTTNEDGHFYPNLTYPIPEQREERPMQDKFQNGLIFRGNDLSEVWYNILSTVYQKGVYLKSGHGGIEDLGSVMAVFPMGITDTMPPNLTRQQLDQYSQTVLTDTEIEGDSYTYGNRIGNQIHGVAKVLNLDPNSNRAVISLWDPQTDPLKLNPPCLISIGYQIRQNRLYCRAVFRSHDIGSGWYPNAYALTRLSEVLLGFLEDPMISLGEMTIISESAHIYQSALSQIGQILKEKPKSLALDPVGNFVIVVASGDVKIDHYSYGGGQRVRSYRNPKQVLEDHPTIDTAHYGYLCGEFARACILKNNFVQDRP